MGSAWRDDRERIVLLVIDELDQAGHDVTSDSIYEFLAKQPAIDLGSLPTGTSVPDDPSLDATKVQVLQSLDALQRENPPYITATPLTVWQSKFPLRFLNVRLTAHGRSGVENLRQAIASAQRPPVGFQPPHRTQYFARGCISVKLLGAGRAVSFTAGSLRRPRSTRGERSRMREQAYARLER